MGDKGSVSPSPPRAPQGTSLGQRGQAPVATSTASAAVVECVECVECVGFVGSVATSTGVSLMIVAAMAAWMAFDADVAASIIVRELTWAYLSVTLWLLWPRIV